MLSREAKGYRDYYEDMLLTWARNLYNKWYIIKFHLVEIYIHLSRSKEFLVK
jgi:hypothetical protein